MHSYPKISIITACLNAARTIETTIKSVLDQNYQNLEYIVIDGASSDGTLEIIDKYEDKIAKLVSEPDKGLYYAFNKGISLATGELIGIINADDLYLPWTFSMISRCYLRQPEHALYYGNTVLWDENNGKAYFFPLNFSRWDFQRVISITHPACFFTKHIYDKYGVYDTHYKIAADWNFLLRLFVAKESFIPLDFPLAIFRWGGTAATHRDKTLEEGETVLLEFTRNQKKTEKIYNKMMKQSIFDFIGVLILKWISRIGRGDFYFKVKNSFFFKVSSLENLVKKISLICSPDNYI